MKAEAIAFARDGSAERHLGTIAETLLQHSSVEECTALSRRNDRGEIEIIVYVVSSGPFMPARLHSYLSDEGVDGPLPTVYVPLASLPLTPEGTVDRERVSAIAVCDNDLIERWEASLTAESVVSDLGVAVLDYADTVAPLHLSDLFPNGEYARIGSTEGFQNEVQAEYSTRNAPIRPVAYSDGGPLELPAGAPTTFTEAIHRTAARYPERGITYIRSDGSKLFQSYPILLSEAKCILTGLQRMGLRPGDRVILQLEALQDHFASFWACVLGGITPVTVAVAPSYAEQNGIVSKLYNTWKLLDRPVVITNSNLLEPISGLTGLLNMAELRVLSVDELKANPPSDEIHPSEPDDLLFFQLTSGSTGVPKCIQERHRSVICHIHGSQQFNGYTPDNVSLNWLPVDHVVPILTVHLKDLYLGCAQVHVRTDIVLSQPLTWLDLLEEHSVTHTWAPNFGFKLLTDHLRSNPGRRWDLSSIEFFMNAGEQVTLSVVREFLDLVRPFGVPSQALQPSFGMAEACTCMTYRNDFTVGTGVHRILKSSIAGDLVEAEPGEVGVVDFVDLGPPIPGVQIRITDSYNSPVREGVIGRFQIKGGVITPGYLNNEKANQEAFVGDGWFNSGDIGFILNGCLTLTGREKEMIIVRGANFYCYEIEDIVNTVPGVEPTFVGASAVEDPSTGTEGLAIFYVPNVATLRETVGVVKAIRARVTAALGISPSFVIPLQRTEFPKTTSGKIQRTQMKTSLLNGQYSDILKELDIAAGNANTLPSWFYRPFWRPKEALVRERSKLTGTVLVFTDKTGMAERLHLLTGEDTDWIIVEPGPHFARNGPNHFNIDPDSSEDYHLLVAALNRDGRPLVHAVHLWTYVPASVRTIEINDVEANQRSGLFSLIFLVQALAQNQGSEYPVRILVASTNTQMASPDQTLNWAQAPLLGIIQTVSQEMPYLDCRHVDLPGTDPTLDAQSIAREFIGRGDREVAYRDGHRLIQRLERVDLTDLPQGPMPLKDGGMYMITGGLGGVALEIARHLIHHYNARLLLVGRTTLPERTSWDKEQPASVRERTESLRDLEALGGTVLYVSADVCDPDQLRSAVAAAERAWVCTLDGVFHLAGHYRDQLLVEESAESFAAAIRPKVAGSLAIHNILMDRPECLFVAFSSTTSYFGGAMFGAYAAANRFLDRFCQWRREQLKRPTYCFGWSTWNEIGMNRSVPGKDPLRATGRGFLEISREQGVNSLLAGLIYGQSHLLIGLDGGNLNIRRHTENTPPVAQQLCACFVSQTESSATSSLERVTVLDRFSIASACEFVRVDQIPRVASGEIDRLELVELGRKALRGGVERIPPRTKRERKVAHVWQDVLGAAQIGVHDNFFELGGHSLLATLVMARLSDQFSTHLPVRLLFEAPTVASLAERIQTVTGEAESPSLPALVSVERDRDLPLSFAQQRIWFVEQLEPGSPAYNISLAARLNGPLDVAILQKSLSEIVRRHEVLRTTFPAIDGNPMVRIAPPGDFDLSVIDLRDRPESEREAEAHRLAAVDLRTPFDLASGPLLRICLVRLGEEDHALLVNIHHIVSDGWSLGVFNEELSALYGAFLEKRHSPLPELLVQYADYAVWQREWLRGELLDAQLAHWKDHLQDVPTLLELPLDHARPPVQTFRGTHQSFALSRSLTDGLKSLCQSEGVTLFMVLMAAFQLLLSRHSGQDRFIVSTGVANRSRPETQGLIGCLINILLLRADLSGDPSFRDVVARVRESALGAYANQDLPFEKLVEELQPERDLSYNPLTQVMFVLLNAPLEECKLPGIVSHSMDVASAGAQYDIVVHLYETSDGMSGYLDYCTDLFGPETITRFLGHFRTILEAVVADIGQKAATLPLLTSEERHQLLFDFNATSVAFGPALCLHRRIEVQAESQPLAPAVLYGDTTVSYGELDARANQLARHLQGLGVGPDVLVGISVERSVEMVVGILGILKAGGAYVPLDPAYPHERLAFMLEDTGAPVLLTQAHLKARLPVSRAFTVCLDEDWAEISLNDSTAPESTVTPENLSYVIYTSGSTGKPKGIAIRHAGVGNNLLDLNSRFAVGPADRILALSSLSFDMCVYEVLGALCAGAGIVMPEQSQLREPAEWAGLILRNKVTIWNSAPALLKMLVDLVEGNAELWPRTLRLALLGGDWVPISLPDRVRTLAPGLRFIVMGGATEVSIHSTIYEVGEIDSDWRSIPYGHGMANQTAYILDQTRQLVPIGVPGELHLGGEGLGRGYWNRPELTAEKFIAHPFAAGERLYRTGDLARWRPDGEVELLGRIDYMVKLRGLRIELGEIEALLRRHAAVREAVVAAKGSADDLQLVAYIVPEEPQSTQSKEELVQDLRSWVKSHLPDYMTPSAFLLMEMLPLSPNGKVDRKSLPVPEMTESMAPSALALPRTPTEEIVAGIYCTVLGRDRVGMHENFFEVGGHSLLATQVISRIRAAFQIELPVRSLFESPTAAELAESVESRRRAGDTLLVPPLRAVPRSGALPVSYAQQRIWIVDQLSTGGNASYNIPVAAHLLGPLDVHALELSLLEIVRRHEILRTTFTMERGAPVQNISPTVDSHDLFALIDLTGLAEPARMSEALRQAAMELRRPFNLAIGPLMRVHLYRLSAEEHLLLMVSHHIISDGWSISVFNQEMEAIYSAYLRGQLSPLPEPVVQYGDFAVWQREWLQGGAMDNEISYWKEQLANAPTHLDLPTDRPRPPVQSFRGARHTFSLPRELGDQIKQFSHTEGATVYMTLLAGFNTLLSRYGGSEDIVVGSPIAGRTRVETESMIGFFINTLVIRTDLSGSPSFSQLLRRVREVILNATAHQDVQFDKIVEMLRPPRDRSRNPVFQVNFRVQTGAPVPITLSGLDARPVELLDFATAKFDLALDISASDLLYGYIEYNTDLFDSETIVQMSDDFETTLRVVLSQPATPIASLTLPHSPLSRAVDGEQINNSSF